MGMDRLNRRRLDGTGAAEVHADELLDKVDELRDAASVRVKHTDEGGLAILMTNNTGAVSVKGILVEVDTAIGNAVKVAGADSAAAAGVMYDNGVADGSECWVVVFGIAQVLLKDATASTRGYWVKSSDAAGRADATNAAPPGGGIPELDEHMQEIGHCIESKGADTDVLAKVLLHFN